MGATRRAKRSIERRRIAAARREYRARARLAAIDEAVWSPDPVTPEPETPTSDVPDAVSAFRRITGEG